MESFLILKCFSTAAQTISLVMLDVPGMHLSMSVVHSMNVLFSLLRGRAASAWAWTAIRQPMTVKAEAHRSAWLTVIAVPPGSSSNPGEDGADIFRVLPGEFPKIVIAADPLCLRRGL
jgi:hypothetical protein